MADGLLNKASIILTPTGYKAGTLYNVAPVVEPYEDFDFARASVASRVNSSGLVEMVGRTLGSELVVNGNWYSHRGAYFEITNDLIYIENDGNTYGGIEQSFSVSSGKNFQLKYTAIEGTTSTDWRVNIGSSQGGTDLYSKGQILDFTENTIITSTSSEIWIRIYNNTPTIGDNFSIDNVSVKEIIDTNNIPRISYDSNGDNGHILLEPTSTNLVGYSLPNDTNWSKGINTTITENYAVSPDGTQNASRLVMPTGSGTFAYYQFTATSTTDHTLSFYAKNNGGDADVTMEFFLPSGTKNITLTNEWQRFEFTRPVTSGDAVQVGVDNITSVDMLIYGVQCEALGYATSYIPTYGSTETRATETATGAGSADLINSTEGVLYAEMAALVNGGANRYISLSDNTTSNRLNVIFSSNADRLTISGTGNIGSFTNVNFFSYTQNIYNKIAIKYSSSGVKLFVNGSLEGSNSDNVSWTSNTLTTLDFSLWNQSTAPFEGKVKALAVFNEALSDSELTQLTT